MRPGPAESTFARASGSSSASRFAIGGSPVEADVVVGADGANGTSARALGLGAGIVHGVALEGNVPYASLRRDRYRRRAIVELADIPGGYGWVFPKGDHVNVGVGAWQDEGPRLREHLARTCEAHGVRFEALEHLRGHRLPLRPPGVMIASERALLVGDAAGLIDPVSGDGMYECFVSAALAAAAIDDLLAGRSASLVPYGAAVDAALGPLHRASWKLKRATRPLAGGELADREDRAALALDRALAAR